MGTVPVVCHYNFQFVIGEGVETLRRAWWKGKYVQIDRHIREIDWDYEFSYLNVSDMYSRFLKIVSSLIESFVPLIKIREETVSKPPAEICRERKDLWHDFKNVRAQHGRGSLIAAEALEKYHAANNLYRNFHFYSQLNLEKRLVNLFRDSSKFFHSYIRKKKVGVTRVGPLRLSDGSLTDSPVQMAELFAGEFSSGMVFQADFEQEQYHQINTSHTIEEVLVTEQIIQDKLSKPVCSPQLLSYSVRLTSQTAVIRD